MLGRAAACLPPPERSSEAGVSVSHACPTNWPAQLSVCCACLVGAMTGRSALCGSFRRRVRQAFVSSRPRRSGARYRALGRCRCASEPQRGREATCGQAWHNGAACCCLEPQRRPPCEPRTCLAAALQWNRAQHTHRGQHAQVWLCTRASSRVSSVRDHLRPNCVSTPRRRPCARGVCDRSACRVRTFPHAEAHVTGGRGPFAYAERLRSVVMYKI